MGQVESASLQQNIDSKRTFSPGPHLEQLVSPGPHLEELVSPSPHHRHLQHILQLHLHQGPQAPQPLPGMNTVTSFLKHINDMTRK